MYSSPTGIFREAGDRHNEGIALGLLGCVLPEAQRDEAIAALEGAVAAFQETGEPELERTVMSGLLSLKFPVPSPAELRARIDAGSIDKIAPGLWGDVTVLGEQGDEERRRLAEELRARMRKAAADAADKAARQERESAE